MIFFVSSVLNDLNNRYHQCLEKASQLKQLIEPGLQTLDGKAMTVSLFKDSANRKAVVRQYAVVFAVPL